MSGDARASGGQGGGATTPWEGKHWSVSPHNFAEPIAIPPRPVQLHDVTIRDGEECADLVYTVDDKVRIAEALAQLGVRRTELFLTVPGWYEAVRAVMARRLPLDLYVTWDEAKTPRVLDLGVRHVMVWYRASDVYQRHAIGRERAALLAEALEAVRTAKGAGAYVNFFMPESTRMELGQLRDTVTAAEQAGVDAFTLVDSLAITRPAALGYLVREVKAATKLPVEVHCHNDYGLATACVLAAYEAGADALNCSVNAVGYRAGNAALDEVAVALEALYGVETGLRLELLPWIAHLVATITRIPIGYFKGVTGGGAMRVEQWGATARLAAAGQRRAAFAFEPEWVGRSPEVVVGKWSDLGAVEKQLRDLGLSATADQLATLLRRCQEASLAAHRPLQDSEFLTLARAVGATGDDAR
jgi:isopropylmalate/homocitrate/citramalate synthase